MKLRPVRVVVSCAACGKPCAALDASGPLASTLLAPQYVQGAAAGALTLPLFGTVRVHCTECDRARHTT